MKNNFNKSILVIIFLGISIIFLYIARTYVYYNLLYKNSGYYNMVLDYMSNARLIISLILVVFSIFFALQTKKSVEIQDKLSKELEEYNINLQAKVEESTAELEQYAKELQAKSDNMEKLLKQMSDEVEIRKKLEAEANIQRLLNEEIMVLELELSKLNNILLGETELEKISSLALSTVSEFLKVQTGAVFIKESDNSIHRKAVYAFSDSFGKSEYVLLGEGIVGEVAKSGIPSITKFPGTTYSAKFGSANLQLIQVIDYPLVYKDDVMGVIEIGLLNELSENYFEWFKKAVEIISISLKLAKDSRDMSNLMNKILLDEERFRQILESSGEGLLGMDTEGKITFINPAAYEILGYTSYHELIGENFNEKFYHKYSNGEGYPDGKCFMRLVCERERATRIDDEVFWTKDGTPVPVEYMATPIKENEIIVGVVVSFRDITERKQNEAKLKRSEERFKLATESAGIATWEWNIAQDSIIASEKYVEIIGFDPQKEKVSKILSERMHDDSVKLAYQALNDHLEGKKIVIVSNININILLRIVMYVLAVLER